ncbi:hypothetical protein AJ79_04645 [Helicocarpus griseus UAMH5409]|uniref:Uncharacterized protein n=1 Tax=Helicocarpus griseus UAMH5409 TaxID=1447875 RepID=A0A2B7XTD8_9EURO|nr:hypothetical protein AJ79_04645 [Helicocarpus griseus UAMH5409]
MAINHEDPTHECDRPGRAQDSPAQTSNLMNAYGTTHGDRIDYLQRLRDEKVFCPIQDQNLDATIEYHRQFPAGEEEIRGELIWLQDGRAYYSLEEGVDIKRPLWTEGFLSCPYLMPVDSPVVNVKEPERHMKLGNEPLLRGKEHSVNCLGRAIAWIL